MTPIPQASAKNSATMCASVARACASNPCVFPGTHEASNKISRAMVSGPCGAGAGVPLSQIDEKCPAVNTLNSLMFQQSWDGGTLGTRNFSRKACARERRRAGASAHIRARVAVPTVPPSQLSNSYIYINKLIMGQFSSVGTVGTVIAGASLRPMPANAAGRIKNCRKINGFKVLGASA